LPRIEGIKVVGVANVNDALHASLMPAKN